MGTLIVDPESGERVALLAAILQEPLGIWSHKKRCIPHVEQAALVMVICRAGSRLKGRGVIWLIDATVSFSAKI